MADVGDGETGGQGPIRTIEPPSDPGAEVPERAAAYVPPRSPPGQYAKKVHTQRVKLGEAIDPADVEHSPPGTVVDLASVEAPTVISRLKARERSRWAAVTIVLLVVALAAFAYAISILAA